MSAKAASMNSTPNVVIFGEEGVGKSSVVNMIAGREVASTPGDSSDRTFDSKSFLVDLDGRPVRLWDTVGLHEGGVNTGAKDAIVNLYKLLKSLESGINLLVYCVRGPQPDISRTTRNYKIFNNGLCQKQVPIVLVVTGLEEEESTDKWWAKNKESFGEPAAEMSFKSQACVTATRGKLRDGTHVFEQEYEESTSKVRKLVGDNCHHGSWQLKTSKSSQAILFAKIVVNMGIGVFNLPPLILCHMLYEVLKEHGGFSDIDARKIANAVEI
jgi:tRNA U34 5-carboxymethylaminomethyl modifying GTPase MnmE/TrmE